jgi:hypothetical protein
LRTKPCRAGIARDNSLKKPLGAAVSYFQASYCPPGDIDTMDFFAKLADNRIREAMEAGDFDDLQGKGQPLNLEDDSHIPVELRMAYKILKNADCLPPEVVLRQEVVQLQDLVAAMPDEAEKLKQMRRLNFLIMKLNMMRPVSSELLEHDLYTPKVLERLESKK